MLKQSLYELSLFHPCINTHCHIAIPYTSPATLPEFFQKSYLNWQFKQNISPDMDISSFLDLVSCNSYFYSLSRALGELYTTNQLPLSHDNWREIQSGLAESAKNPCKLEWILRKKCNYHTIILDSQNSPGANNGIPSLFRPAFRFDMFLKAHPQAGKDINGNIPWDYLPPQHELSFDEFLDAITYAVRKQVSRGVVALKLAIAYERGLDFDFTDLPAARRGWHSKGASSYECKAFEDIITLHLCRVAGDLKIPVQIHTGMGKLERSNALWLKSLLDACPHTKFVLLHCSYPHTADAIALLHEYSNVYADFSWLPLLSPGATARLLDEILDISDTSRLGWGCDAETLEESLGAHRMFCSILADVLSEKEAKGLYSLSTCRQLVSRILFDAPSTLYGI